ncbi:hypothetical protein NDU88_000857 [Pleurodeles waltl]|uniref:Uncharacterized protein n=1 Tax=Pleurodeles waltl TaxID=8319 RepID=A0AAV7V8P4_PLEWA|nr:hypothetical protein NDU88_000857 [Pleurodeles waltl]
MPDTRESPFLPLQNLSGSSGPKAEVERTEAGAKPDFAPCLQSAALTGVYCSLDERLTWYRTSMAQKPGDGYPGKVAQKFERRAGHERARNENSLGINCLTPIAPCEKGLFKSDGKH